jgi:hypothetical protein
MPVGNVLSLAAARVPLHNYKIKNVKVKVNFILEEAMKSQRCRRDIALLFLESRPLYAQKETRCYLISVVILIVSRR